MILSTKEKSRLVTKYGEWAIVTGASSGIGFELALQLAEAGFHLVLHGRNQSRLEKVRDLARSKNVEVKIVTSDLSEKAGVEEIIQSARGLNVGLLVNNAGFGTSGSFVDSSIDEEISMIQVNCTAVVQLTQHFAQEFKIKKRGGIIFLSSLVAFQGVPYASGYAATKAFVQSFAEALTIELKPFGVDVLAAAPGPVDTGFASRANMRMGMALAPKQLAAPILRALGKQTNVIPGWFSKLLVYSLRTAPRPIKVKIMEKVMGGFTQHQRAQ